MMKTLVNETAGFSLVVDSLKASEILEAVKAAELSIGLTSLRSLLKGDVESVKGFALVDVAEAPVDANPEWNHAALAAAQVAALAKATPGRAGGADQQRGAWCGFSS